MAKKRTSSPQNRTVKRKEAATSTNQETDVQSGEPDEGKTAFLLRLNREIHEKLKYCAEAAGISLNQLILGICEGTVDNLMVGEASRNSSGCVVLDRSKKKCVGVGREGYFASDEFRAKNDPYIDEYGREDYLPPNSKGFLWFGIDYRDGGAVAHAQD